LFVGMLGGRPQRARIDIVSIGKVVRGRCRDAGVAASASSARLAAMRRWLLAVPPEGRAVVASEVPA
jgi:hypothetical protein